MQAWHKQQKVKAIKKGKAQNLKERTEKLAKRNPDVLQRKVDDLRAVVEAGRASPHDRKTLADLERDLSAVLKARASLGVEDWRGRKRPRTEEDSKPDNQKRTLVPDGEESDSGESTSSSVREIPLPPGPLPPLPDEELPPKPDIKTTYEAAPILRDLRKEAATFVPAAVKRKMEQEKAQTQGKSEEAAEDKGSGNRSGPSASGIGVIGTINAAPDVDVDQELNRFHAEIEEVEDNGQ